MPARDPEMRRLVGRAGGAVSKGRPDAAERRAELATARLEAHIRKVVDAAPPLSAAQRDRLAALLRPTAADAGQPEPAVVAS